MSGKMKTYFAIGHKEPDSACGIWFPDVEGCFGAGDTYEDAVEDASEALKLHVEMLRQDGQDIPHPRTIDEINLDPAVRKSRQDKGSFVIAIPLVVLPKAKKVPSRSGAKRKSGAA